MKKILFSTFLTVACIALLSSCAKEETFDKTFTSTEEVNTEKVISTDQDHSTYECGTQENYLDEEYDGGCGG